MSACCSLASEQGTVLIFDENPENGLAYDPSDLSVQTPARLRADGFSTNKIPLTTNAFRGNHALHFEWNTSGQGSWSAMIASPHWALRQVAPGSAFRFFVNSPKALPIESLPTIAAQYEDRSRSKALPLAHSLTNGVDDDPATWQEVVVPGTSLQLAEKRLQGIVFASVEGSGSSGILWADYIHFVNPTSPALPGEIEAIDTVAGDRALHLYWVSPRDSVVDGYHVERSIRGTDDWTRLTTSPLDIPAYVDTDVTNRAPVRYRIRAINAAGESVASPTSPLTARAFRSDDHFLDYLQRTGFWYFWQQANPTNGLVRDRSHPMSFCSIAATGFGLTAITTAIDREWIGRGQGRERVWRTLRTFASGPQGDHARGMIGHKGWFYHFLEMDSATRFGNSELSSIDSALLLGGILHAREYFDGNHIKERQIREWADQIFNRIDWRWMTNGEASLTMGWHPETGFIKSRWIGYNEAMLLYILALGADEKVALGPESWSAWTSGYEWKESYGLSFLHFEPLFGHQYSHCWVDFSGIADAYTRAKGITYFENSRRATLAQQRYAVENPKGHAGYGPNMWGFTACDGPGYAGIAPYMARGAPPALNDDGTIAPTAAGGSVPFAPEICIPTLRNIYETHRRKGLHPYGFVDAFNSNVDWFDGETLGIDQGPIVLMIANHRSGSVWKTFMKHPAIQRGLERAGFTPYPAPRRAR